MKLTVVCQVADTSSLFADVHTAVTVLAPVHFVCVRFIC